MKTVRKSVSARRQAALVIVDIQNDFISPKGAFARMGIEINNLRAIVQPIRELRESLTDSGVTTIYLVSHYDDVHLTDSIRERYKRVGYHIPFCLSETWGSQVVDELEPQKDSVVVAKHRYNGFLGTDLEPILREMNFSTLIFTGVETHVCVQQTAIHAYMLGYSVILVEDCTASVGGDDKGYALEYCKRYYGVVKSSREVLEYSKP